MNIAFSDRENAQRPTLALRTAPFRDAPLRDAASAMPPCHDARRLTGAQGTATILLDGQAYVLRITRAGKLILTK
jgi:hemin uptake protein HemP